MQAGTSAILLTGLLGAEHVAVAEQWDTFSDTWVATDGLGRPLPTCRDVGLPKQGKTVGVFYYIWHGAHGYGNTGDPPRGREAGQGVRKPVASEMQAPYVIPEILKKPEAERNWGKPGAFHHWGEPLFGFYVANDDWVIRRHAQMLADAGVDVIFLDVTNGFHYRDIYLNLCRVYEEIRKEGGRTPQIAFNCGILPENNRVVVDAVYHDLYEPGLYKDLWFIWKGKPLILANFDALDPKYRDFFNLRFSWAWSQTPTRKMEWWGDGKDRWAWLDRYPQNYGWHENPKAPEQMAVATAEHPISDIGKSFYAGKSPRPLQSDKGLYFAEQWKRALEVAPEFLFITQWNEWVAQRFVANKNAPVKRMAGEPVKVGDTFFVDLLNTEYNRDIEPMKGGYGDNYYYQMIDGIRRFKGVRPVPVARSGKTIDPRQGFGQWEDVQPEYRDTVGDTVHRNHFGWGGTGLLTNDTGRNDIQRAKVTHDCNNVYFYVDTVSPLTSPEGENWMELFIAVDGLPGNTPNWEGFHDRLHFDPKNKTHYAIERSSGGWLWQNTGEAGFQVQGNKLMLAVPRKLLGIEASEKISFRFKWSDNRQTTRAIDWLVNGDTAPDGRFQYQYRNF